MDNVTDQSKGGDIPLVTTIEHQQLAVLLIRLVPAVDYLVAPLVDINTLAIITSELFLCTPRQLQSHIVRFAFVAA